MTTSLTISPDHAWLTGAEVRHCPSSHFNQRPPSTVIDLLVIHTISLPPNEFGGQAIDDFFTGQLKVDEHPFFKEIQHLKVSAHLLIRRTGEIVQYVSFLDRAYHAGVSCFQQRENCNDFSIGIELEGNDLVPYTLQQYQRLVATTRLLQQHFPAITHDHIVGHCHIAPARKADPYHTFDWQQYFALLTAETQR